MKLIQMFVIVALAAIGVVEANIAIGLRRALSSTTAQLKADTSALTAAKHKLDQFSVYTAPTTTVFSVAAPVPKPGTWTVRSLAKTWAWPSRVKFAWVSATNTDGSSESFSIEDGRSVGHIRKSKKENDELHAKIRDSFKDYRPEEINLDDDWSAAWAMPVRFDGKHLALTRDELRELAATHSCMPLIDGHGNQRLFRCGSNR